MDWPPHFTRPVRASSWLSVSASPSCQSSSSRTSRRNDRARPPVSSISWTVRSAPARSTSVTQTKAPRAASARLVARQLPLPAPVLNAALFPNSAQLPPPHPELDNTNNQPNPPKSEDQRDGK